MIKLKLERVRVESFTTQTANATSAPPAEMEDGVFGCISYCSPCFFTQQYDCTRQGC